MDKELTLLGGVGLGASLFYFLDPQQGRRRRALMRDKVVSLMHRAGNAVGPTARDVSNRTQGLVAGTKSRFSHEVVPDYILVERIRSQMGRYISHPGALEVQANQGRVTLTGPILAHEVGRLIDVVSHVPGVHNVENRMEVHRQPGNVPGLQGGSVPQALVGRQWPPATRLLTGTAGGMLTLYGAGRRDLIGTFLSGIGLGMVARGVSNLEMKRLLGVDAGRRAVDLQKTININAPVEEVYNFWSNFENFPRFMTHVREVKHLGNGRSHWTVDGPAGVPVTWNAIITKRIANETLAWRSEPGSVVGNSGIIHFTPNAKGGTQIHIKLSYNPPAGAIGHTVASFFGSDPKTAMDEDLMRFKSLIEEGKTTVDGQTVRRQEVEPQEARW